MSKANRFRFINTNLRLYIAKFSVYLCVMVLVVNNLPLNPSYVFSLIALYEILRLATGELLFLGVIQLAEVNISTDRIQNFLLQKSTKSSISTNSKKLGVFTTNLTVKWDSSNIFENVNFEAVPGQLVALIGSAGSGKSTFIQTLLGETEISGIVNVARNISYAPQDPWIFSGSLKENVVFCENFDKERYCRVIKVCNLEQDLALFAEGDQTLVGERGMKLSGGQKARINLARAVYRNADVYLLDDPLSSVDSYVAKDIFENCILEFLKEKCVILVTHQIQFLGKVDKIYLASNSKIVNVESLAQCEKSIKLKNKVVDKEIFQQDVVEQLFVKETVVERNSVYNTYLEINGKFVLIVTIFLFLLSHSLILTHDYFLAFWLNFVDSGKGNLYDCFYIYTGLLLAYICLSHVTSFSFVQFCTKASEKVHNSLFKKTVNGSMSFFNSNSSGQILNLFAKDVGGIDEYVPQSLYMVITQFLLTAGSIILIIAFNYWTLLPTITILGIFKFFNNPFRTTIKIFKNLEATSNLFQYIIFVFNLNIFRKKSTLCACG